MQQSPDNPRFAWTNYGSDVAVVPAIDQAGAVVVVDLDTVSAAIAATALPAFLQQWAKSPEVYALVLRLTQPKAAPDAAARPT